MGAIAVQAHHLAGMLPVVPVPVIIRLQIIIRRKP